MGKITQGILGGFSGKVGPVVGAKWKGIDYMRGYVVPANPQTTKQQQNRGTFAVVSSALSQFLYLSIRPFTDAIAVRMSGYNLLARISREMMQDSAPRTFNATFLAISAGPIDEIEITGVADDAPDTLVSWVTTAPDDPTGTDAVSVYQVNIATGEIEGSLTGVTRAGAGDGILGTGGFDPDQSVVVAFAHRDDGTIDARASYTTSWGATAAVPIPQLRRLRGRVETETLPILI